jgi:hypothetical protein
MKIHSLLFTGLLTLANSIMAQTPMIFCWPNPSIEGPRLPNTVPFPWISCYATPDTQPGNWGITQAPSADSSYVSFLRDGSLGLYNEGMAQIMNPFIAPGTYVFTVDLAHSMVYTPGSDPMDCYSSLAVYGGYSACHQGELLWESDDFTHTSWETYSVMIEPTSPWTYITFCPQYLYSCGNGKINVMMDNLTCIEPVKIVKPRCDGSSSGSITVTPPSALSTPPFTYSWSTGLVTSSNTITGLSPGTYTVNISDSGGKTINYTFILKCE